MSNKLYNKDSIESLSPLEFTRLRPGVYAGDTTYSTQLLVEIVSNAIDEFNLGHGNTIEVTINNSKNTIVVRDYGQGFLVNEMREDGKTVLEAAFSVLNTSGKYREDGTYEGTSLGSFGVGSKITTYLSHWLTVTTFRNGQYERVDFDEGVFSKREIGTTIAKNGTMVHWKPSEEFFTHPEVDMKTVKSLFETLTCLCPGLTIRLVEQNDKEIIDNIVTTTYHSNNGLDDYVDNHVGDKEMLKNRLSINYQNGKNKMNAVLTYASGYSSNIIPYINTGLTESGPHITAFKTAITREFNKFFRDKNWIKEKESNLSGEDIQEGLYLVFNLTTSGVTYDAQVKSRVVNIETKEFMQEFAAQLQQWLRTNEKEIKNIAEKALSARKAREAAKKARDSVRGKAEKKAVLKMPSKLTDAWSKDREKCELFVTEGDSATGGIKEARDNEIQAVLPVRGKIINCWKTGLDKILANAEIRDMIKAFGFDINAKTGKVVYDEDKLRYDKIIISADADVDGRHIQSLFYTFIWSFVPELIYNGHVYATVPPLFKVTIGKDYHYVKDEEALEDFKRQHSGRKLIVNRLKGLGEMSPDELAETILDKDNRNIKQITVEDAKKATDLFDQLMGSSADLRKKYIVEHAGEVEIYD